MTMTSLWGISLKCAPPRAPGRRRVDRLLQVVELCAAAPQAPASSSPLSSGGGTSARRSEPDRGLHHTVRGFDAVCLHPCGLFCGVDRERDRVVSVWPADDDRLAGSDLP